MDYALIHLLLATTIFVLSHFAMSGPLRRSLASAMGAQGFLIFYSAVSLGTFVWAMVAFDRSASGLALWDGTALVPWIIASVLTIVAMALLFPSFVRNPALPGQNNAGLRTVIPMGVYSITRHPMMWGIALWALGHIIAAPTFRVIIFMTGMIVLALVGSHLQDKRKLAGNSREFAPWQRRTSFWPRWRRLGALREIWLLALVAWFLITWAHYHFFGIPAGLWLWIG
ncbi:MAG: NnrU family protein [Novosphingobium meiothermophilum]